MLFDPLELGDRFWELLEFQGAVCCGDTIVWSWSWFWFLSEFSTSFLRVFGTNDIFLSINFYAYFLPAIIFDESYYFWRVCVLRRLMWHSLTKISSFLAKNLIFLHKSSTEKVYVKVVPDPTEVIKRFSTWSPVLFLREFKNLADLRFKPFESVSG